MTVQTLPLDIEYDLSSEETSLLKRATGIQDDEELKQHVLEVQSEAYAVHPYACIRGFNFAKFRITKHPAYQSVLKLGKERKNAIFLELPCCVGGDSRVAILDGYPSENVITSDLLADYWTIGHKLFRTTPETYGVPFLQGDIFDPNFLRPGVPPLVDIGIVGTPPPLKSLTSLTPLQHHVSVIYTSLFFHLFEEDKQRQLAFLFSSLLSPTPGSIIFGFHVGASDSDEDKLGRKRANFRGDIVFAHSPASWRELWTGKDGPFKPDQVSVEVKYTVSYSYPRCPLLRHTSASVDIENWGKQEMMMGYQSRTISYNGPSINSKLPQEILCRIFGLSCPIYRLLEMNRYLHLMKICRLWRRIIQNDPTFWNLTDFGSPYEDLLLETLERSKAIQLTVIVPFNNYFSTESRKGLIWQSFIAHDHWRVRNLHLKLSGSLRLDKNMFRFLGKYKYPSLEVFTIDHTPTFPNFPLLESLPITENIKCLNIPIPLLDYLLTNLSFLSFPRLQTLSIALTNYDRLPAHSQTQVFAFLQKCPSVQSLELTFSLAEPSENIALIPWSAFPGVSLPKLTKVWVDDFRWSDILSRFVSPKLEFYDIVVDKEDDLLNLTSQFDYSQLRSLCIEERSFNPLRIIGHEKDYIFPLKHHLHQPLYPLHLKGELVDPYPGREIRIKLLNPQHAPFYLRQCFSLMNNIQCLFLRHQNTNTSNSVITWNLKEILRDAVSLRALFIAGGNPRLDTVLEALLDAEVCPRLEQLGYRENCIYRREGETVAPFPDQTFTEVLRIRKLKELQLDKFNNIPEEWLEKLKANTHAPRIVITDALSNMIYGTNNL